MNSADASSPVETVRFSAENCDDNRLESRTHEQYSRERERERERETADTCGRICSDSIKVTQSDKGCFTWKRLILFAH